MIFFITFTIIITITIPRCSHNFAKTVLTAVRDGTVEELKRRKGRSTAVGSSEWPERVLEYLLLPSNSRTQPGAASVSVAYGVRKPKVYLVRTRRDILEDLREKYKDEVPPPPSVSTLSTCIPAYFLAPREADRENNICVKHANLAHLATKLRPLVPSLPVSSREISLMVMCDPWHPPMVVPPGGLPSTWHPPMVLPPGGVPATYYTEDQPLTWPKACSLR